MAFSVWTKTRRWQLLKAWSVISVWYENDGELTHYLLLHCPVVLDIWSSRFWVCSRSIQKQFPTSLQIGPLYPVLYRTYGKPFLHLLCGTFGGREIRELFRVLKVRYYVWRKTYLLSSICGFGLIALFSVMDFVMSLRLLFAFGRKCMVPLRQ